jgi:hypothetical protein
MYDCISNLESDHLGILVQLGAGHDFEEEPFTIE